MKSMKTIKAIKAIKKTFSAMSALMLVTVLCLGALVGCDVLGRPSVDETEGPEERSECELNGHTWTDATCVMPRMCTVCGEIADDVLGEHNFVDDVCTVCGILAPHEETSEGPIEPPVVEELEFELDESTDTYIVMGKGTYTGMDVVIPSTYNGKPVTGIYEKAFYHCYQIESIIIPDSVTDIPDAAFWACEYLESVTVGNGVTSIGSCAFLSCYRLESVKLGNGVKLIGETAFGDCTSLASINIPDSVTYIGNYAFEGCSSLVLNTYDNAQYLGNEQHPYLALIKAKDTDITSCRICDHTKFIYSKAFMECNSLASVNIPAGVTALSDSVFSGCSSLKSVIIPDGVIDIGRYAFSDCTSLESINIPSGIKVLNEAVFNYCSSLKSINIPNGLTDIGHLAFSYCSSLKSINIPDSVTWIGDAFSGCDGLEAVYITDLAAWCKIDFYQPNLGSFTSNPLECAGNLYLNGKLVTSIVIPKGITSINASAFEGCRSLTSVTIPDGVTSIGKFAFLNCSNLTELSVPSTLTYVGEYALTGCGDLKCNTYRNAEYLGNGSDPYVILFDASNTIAKTIEIHPRTKIIYDCAFENGSITDITIPDRVTGIGYAAFRYCKKLKSITIPKSVSYIGKNAFTYCNSLEAVHITDIKAWLNIEFSSDYDVTNPLYYAHKLYLNDSLVKKLVIPEDVDSIKAWAFIGCTSLEELVIHSGVTSIRENAFRYCGGLQSISVAEGNAVYTSAGNCLVDIKSGMLLLGSNNSVIPTDGSVKDINNYAFYGCSGITAISIPDSVKTIGDNAFYGCSGLKTLTIGSGVSRIDDYAFAYCGELDSINVAQDNGAYSSAGNCLVRRYDGNLILGCNNSVIPTDGSVKSIESRAFVNCQRLTAINIPESVTYISLYAFYGCSGLESISVAKGNAVYHSDGNCLIHTETKELRLGCKNSIIPSDGSVDYLSDDSFNGCTSLTNITIPDTILYMGSAFSDCSGLINIVIPNSVTRIESSAFSGCSSLTSITIPDSVTWIGDSSFSGCSSLTDIYYSGTSEQWESIEWDGWNWRNDINSNWNIHFLGDEISN